MIAVRRYAEVDEVLATMRTTRRRLDLSRSVPGAYRGVPEPRRSGPERGAIGSPGFSS